MTVAPNPSNGIIKVNLSQAGTELHIYDAMVKSVLHQQILTQETFFDQSGFPSGIYFLQAWNGSGREESGGGEEERRTSDNIKNTKHCFSF